TLGFTPDLAGFENDVWIECRESEIGQVIINLLVNACDAVEMNSDERWLRIELSETPSEALLKIIDSGPGVDAELITRIMDPFFTTKPKGSGTGLGLSISKTIVQAHGGSIYLDGEAKSTTFVVKLP